MTVGAINYSPSSYYYTSASQGRIFGTSVSDDSIQILMDQYNIKQTGNQDYDLQQLYNAMYSDAESYVTSVKTAANQKQIQENKSEQEAVEAQNASNVPWATLMQQIGLSATGNLTADYNAFNNTISIMQASARTPQEKASISQLQSQASVVFVQSDQSGTSFQGQGSSASVSGADILAQLNKMYMGALG